MTRKKLPSELVADIKTRLERIEAKVSGVTSGIVFGQEAISAGEGYWRALDEAFGSKNVNKVAASGYEFLESLDKQVRAIEGQASLAADQVQSFVSNVGIYADVTASTATVMGLPIDFDTNPLKQLRYSFAVHDDYSQRLGRIDPALGRTFAGIKDAYFGSSSDRLRQALSEARQTFDHLLEVLVPDDAEVRRQPWWVPADPNKPEVVTRVERMQYAAQKWVTDPNQRDVLIKGSKHMNAVYNRLQVWKKRGTIDEAEAKSAVSEMLSIIRTWADSLSTQ